MDSTSLTWQRICLILAIWLLGGLLVFAFAMRLSSAHMPRELSIWLVQHRLDPPFIVRNVWACIMIGVSAALIPYRRAALRFGLLAGAIIIFSATIRFLTDPHYVSYMGYEIPMLPFIGFVWFALEKALYNQKPAAQWMSYALFILLVCVLWPFIAYTGEVMESLQSFLAIMLMKLFGYDIWANTGVNAR